MNYLLTQQRNKKTQLKYSREIFPGIFQITMPLIVGKPGPVNAYLFVGENVSLIDTGTSKSVTKLENALFELGLTLNDIDQILITHGHGDHYGAAHKIVSKANKKIKVAAHPDDINLIETGADVSEDTVRHFRKLMGISRVFGKQMRVINRFIKIIADDCAINSNLNEGDVLTIGNYLGRVVYTPGHSKGSICIYIESENILFSGDHIIDHIIPNAFVMLDDHHQLPVRMSQKEFMDSIEKIETLSPRVVFSGHGKEIYDLNNVIHRYRHYHDEIQNKVIIALSSGSSNDTVYDLTCRILPEISNSRTQLDVSLAVFEVFTHLQILEKKGVVTFLLDETLGLVYNEI